MSIRICRGLTISCLLAGFLASVASVARSQAPPSAESNYVKLLKRAPEARLGTIIEVIGKRGDAADLGYLLDRATAVPPVGFAAATRVLALDALSEAATTRNLRPAADLDEINPWIASGVDVAPATRGAAIRLAGAWRLASAVPALIEVAGGKSGPDLASRNLAFDALATIATEPARAALARFAGPREGSGVRQVAVAALARVDLDVAANHAAEVIAAASGDQDLATLFAPFLDRQQGAARLLAAIQRHPPASDAAKVALRAISALGRSDEALVAALSQCAGINGDPKPPGPAEMATLIAEVASQGDPVRGERIFRRAELNCMKCHAIAGAAGGVGPELSAVGLSSPVDYLVNSILIPDQAIKEEYQTRTLMTADGRVLQGIVVEEDDRRVVLKDAQGERLVVPTSMIEESKKGGSLMPKGLVATLTRPEFVDLLRFLSELGRPGAYAIRATPTIQRWRALHPVPAGLGAADLPTAALLRSTVLDASPEHWSPLYGWQSGAMPTPEILGAAGGKVGIIQGEILVSAAGPALLRFGSKARPEVVAWADDGEIRIAADGTAVVNLVPGTKRVTVRVDARTTVEPVEPIRVEVVRLADSPAEFSVVGGR